MPEELGAEVVNLQLALNKAAREEAQSMLELLAIAANSPGLSAARFWQVLGEAIIEKTGPSIIPPTMSGEMTKAEAREFSETIVPWGKYKGEKVRDVPTAYWLAMTESEFYLKLRRFVRTPLFAMLQD